MCYHDHGVCDESAVQHGEPAPLRQQLHMTPSGRLYGGHIASRININHILNYLTIIKELDANLT